MFVFRKTKLCFKKKQNFVCFVCRIRFADNAGAKNTPLDWALGAFILNNAKARYDYSGKSRNILGFKKKKVKAM